jgi:hypothetical protein
MCDMGIGYASIGFWNNFYSVKCFASGEELLLTHYVETESSFVLILRK